MQFQGFPKEGLDFLSNIIMNNSKEYLDAHRGEYERFIVDVNKAYIEEMGEFLQILVPSIYAVPKVNKSLFRIYRDARFHKLDPIKEKIGIIFWQGETHRMQSSSFYMHYEPFEVMVATGVRAFKPPLLALYREYIRHDIKREELHNILVKLEDKGYQVVKPQYKRYPVGMDRDDSFSYLYLYGAMYSYHIYTPDESFHNREVLEKHFAIYQDSFELHQWVYELCSRQTSKKNHLL